MRLVRRPHASVRTEQFRRQRHCYDWLGLLLKLAVDLLFAPPWKVGHYQNEIGHLPSSVATSDDMRCVKSNAFCRVVHKRSYVVPLW